MSNQVMNQKEAVYQTTMNVLADHQIAFDDGGEIEKVVTKEFRSEIIGLITKAILANEVEMSTEGRTKYAEEAKMRSYVSGLVSNWYRKDRRLNGNVKHEIANPGSRAGAGDETLKALKVLRSTKEDDAEALAAIDAAITQRQSELKVTKAKTVTVDLEKIPADLREKLGL